MSADLQSAPVGRLGNLAYLKYNGKGAFAGIRTRYLILTKNALCQVSYEGMTVNLLTVTAHYTLDTKLFGKIFYCS